MYTLYSVQLYNVHTIYMQVCHIPEIFHLFYRLLGGVWKPASNEVGIFMRDVFSSSWVSYHLIVQILDMSVTTKECAVAAIFLILDQVSFGRQSIQCSCLSSGWLHSFSSLRNSTVHDHHCCIPSDQDLLCPWPSNWPICHHWEVTIFALFQIIVSFQLHLKPDPCWSRQYGGCDERNAFSRRGGRGNWGRGSGGGWGNWKGRRRQEKWMNSEITKAEGAHIHH